MTDINHNQEDQLDNELEDLVEHQGAGSENSSARRHFLSLAGQAAVYTPPVMLGLSAPSMKAIASSATGRVGPIRSGSGPVRRGGAISVRARRKGGRGIGGRPARQINSRGNNRPN